MNSVLLTGRLTKDPSISYGSNQVAVARFSIAIDRGKDRNGKELGTDYPNIVCFGKTAELVERFLTKGRMVGIQGKLQTGSYEKDGRKVFTTDVVADRVEFLDGVKTDSTGSGGSPYGSGASGASSSGSGASSYGSGASSEQTARGNAIPEGFTAFNNLDTDDIPF